MIPSTVSNVKHNGQSRPQTIWNAVPKQIPANLNDLKQRVQEWAKIHEWAKIQEWA